MKINRSIAVVLAFLLSFSFLALPVRGQALDADKITREMFASAARGTATSSVKDVDGYPGLVAYLSVTANSGTNPTLDLKIQDSPNGNIWFDLVSFAQVTGSTNSQVVTPTRAPAKHIRAVGTVGGSSTPTFTYSCYVVAYKGAAVNIQSTLGGAGAFSSIVANGANGETSAIRYNTELITLSTGGATTNSSANLLPANSLILGVTAIITTAIVGADSTAVQLGDSTTAARFGSGAALTAGTTIVGITHWNGNISTTATGPTQGSAASLRITLAGGGDNTPSAGAIRVSVIYLQFTPPTN